MLSCVPAFPDPILEITRNETGHLQAQVLFVPAQDLFRPHPGEEAITAVEQSVFEPGFEIISGVHIEGGIHHASKRTLDAHCPAGSCEAILQIIAEINFQKVYLFLLGHTLTYIKI